MVDPLSYFTFHPVYHDWYNEDGMDYIKRTFASNWKESSGVTTTTTTTTATTTTTIITTITITITTTTTCTTTTNEFVTSDTLYDPL